MRTKHLFVALAAVASLTACQDQDVLSTPEGMTEGQFVKLEKGFTLVGTTEGSAETRGQWAYTSAGVKFYWRPNNVSGTLKYTPDEIGLAWTGVCLDKDGQQTAGSLLSAADGRVFTNYKFSHFGWKKNGTEPAIDECNPDEGFEPSTYTPVDGYSDGTNTLTGAYDIATGGMIYTAADGAITKWPEYKTANGETNGSEGLFNTNNSTVYAGEYIVYAPYDKNNTSNYIVATSKDNFAISGFVTVDANRGNTINEFTNEIFKYGMTTITDGGAQTTKFATQNLNGYIGLKIQAKAGGQTIKKVILYEPTSKYLLTKVGLSSKGIVNGLAGKNLYLTDNEVKKEYAETITATIKGGAGEALQVKDDGKYSYITIPVLPTETAIPELQVILINDQNRAFITTYNNVNIERNAYAGNAWFEIKDVDFEDAPLIATDETAMKAAIAALTSNGGQVRLLGNIKLSGAYQMPAIATGKTITIYGGKIIVPDAAAGNLIGLKVGDRYTINSNIDVLSSCCKDFGGELNVVGNATLGGVINIGNVEDEAEDNAHEAKLYFSESGKVSALSGTVNNYGIAVIEDANTTTPSHELQIKGGTFNNYNSFTIKTTGDTGIDDPKLFVETGALNNMAGAEMTIQGVLAVGNSATATNNGVVVDKISSQVTGNIQKLGVAPGEYISEVDNEGNRFSYALYNRPTTTVRFVNTVATSYDLNKLKDSRLKSSITTYEVDATAKTTFTAGATKDIIVDMQNLIVKSPLTVVGRFNTTKNYYMTLNVTEALKVEGGTLTFSDVANNEKTVLAAKNMTVYANATAEIGNFVKSEIETLTVNAKGSASAAGKITFGYSSQTWISNKISIKGTAEIIQATGTGANVPGDVWLLEGATSEGDGNWTHGIPTPWS